MAPLPAWPSREPPTPKSSFAYVGQVLCPTLRPGELEVMDNLAPHKSDPTLELIRAAGAEALFLPAYSPDLNPIEKMWSKLKSAPAQCRGRDRRGTGRGHRLRPRPSHRPGRPRLVRLLRL